MAFIKKIFRKEPKQISSPSSGVSSKRPENSVAQDVFQVGPRNKETSPLNDKVWRSILFVIAGCVVAMTVRIVLGLESLLAVWLIALLALAAWFFAIRMLLLDSRLKKFWIVWLAGGFHLM